MSTTTTTDLDQPRDHHRDGTPLTQDKIDHS